MSEPGPDNEFGRRDFLRGAAVLGAGALAGFVALARKPAEAATAGSVPIANPKSLPSGPDQDVLLRMQEELRQAMAKPVNERKWGMVIDTRKCVGCHACTISCIAENKLPPGVVYRPVVTERTGTFPDLAERSIPRPCMHCEEPPCTPVCPVSATRKRADGIVVVDYDKCIGCRYCISACPYGARTADFGENYSDGTPEGSPFESLPTREYGGELTRGHGRSPVGNARKCHFCVHRLEKGELPQCVTTCIGRATFFGDLNDRESLVAELSRRSNTMHLLEHMGTKPVVTYLV